MIPDTRSPNGVTRIPRPGARMFSYEYDFIVVRHENIDAADIPDNPADLISLIQDTVAEFQQVGMGVPVVEIVSDCEDQGYDVGYTSSAQLHFGAQRPATQEEIDAFLRWEENEKTFRKNREIARLEANLAQLKGH